jgi:ethanolamine permease
VLFVRTCSCIWLVTVERDRCERMSGFRASRHQLLALAVVSVLNNSVSKLSYCLRAGLGYEIILNFVAAVAVFIYYCCASELTSTLPFPGGCFGFARCTVGFYPAFLIGCMEIFYYMTCLHITTISLPVQISAGFPSLEKWQFLIIIGAYCLQYCICLSKKVFYPAVTLLAVYGIIINIAYVVGTYPYLDFSKWAFQVDPDGRYWNDDEIVVHPPIVNDDILYGNSTIPRSDRIEALFNPNLWIVVQSFGRCLSVYMQVEYANLAVDDAKNPRADIPFALLWAAGIQFVFSTLNPIIAASMEPGIETASQLQWLVVPGTIGSRGSFDDNDANLISGLAKAFNITQHQAIVLVMPMYFGRMLATCYALGKLISAMAGSRLFPNILAKKVGSEETPVPALSVVSLFGLAVAITFQRTVGSKATSLAGSGINLVCMCGLITYCIQLFGFMVMRVKLSRIQSEFRSPFGVVGAVISFVIFLVGIGSAQLVPTPLRNMNNFVVLSFMALPTAYYFWYAKGVQSFSNAEKEVLLLAHAEIKNANGNNCSSAYM